MSLFPYICPIACRREREKKETEKTNTEIRLLIESERHGEIRSNSTASGSPPFKCLRSLITQFVSVLIVYARDERSVYGNLLTCTWDVDLGHKESRCD
ncbi:unnamed protein product [Brassica oleracea var. botrytis]|uniref:(rape) hypothetical protein n=1 Tax=Brassica napus TaxID=3708 RepID=A0A816R5R6_BRANA|nr:unnamed protein product [Brassica napus]